MQVIGDFYVAYPSILWDSVSTPAKIDSAEDLFGRVCTGVLVILFLIWFEGK